jgi:hypothetical protein
MPDEPNPADASVARASSSLKLNTTDWRPAGSKDGGLVPQVLPERGGVLIALFTAYYLFGAGMVLFFFIAMLLSFASREAEQGLEAIILFLGSAVTFFALLKLMRYVDRALLFPVPMISIDGKNIVPGASFRAHWTLQGMASRFQHLCVTLEGVETATLRVIDDDDCDSRWRFCRVQIHQQSSDFVPAFSLSSLKIDSSAAVTIPADAMHSFAAPNHSIEWRLRLEVPKRGFMPRYRVDFPLVVEPGA